ncbi:MAG: hypothetical protein HOP12_07050 [Candidatus Eisenbacteria bacterium]|uniref:VWA domain-containing protein n=1 Tax=Eiseniibacteriota bacterium TaxID=2212470 RepID=A0A849SHH7_UNCEI|nr:hypothetical protein [Candidatus Eisenbacteria bacterium]
MNLRSAWRWPRVLFVTALAVAACAGAAGAQTVLIDRGVRAGGLWCFPLPTDSLSYVYVPAAARLATDDAGRPQFSFVRYVVNERRDSSTSSTISEARGGGILTFLVLIDTDPKLVEDAQRVLRRTLKNDSISVRGPIVFQDGRYTLVSSILQPGGAARPTVLATGRAPVLEGNRLALSFDLDAERATLLMHSFTMAAPDISLMFDMTIAGLTEAYDAELTIDWSEVKKHKSFSTGGTVYYVSADIELALDELRRDSAIKLKTSGTSASMEALLATVYNKLLELMYKPVKPEQVSASDQNNLAGALSSMFQGKGAFSSRKTMGFGAQIAYTQRETRTEGASVMHFDHRSSVERHALIAFNIGDLFARHGADPNLFRAVNLGDPTFQQREVQVAVDAALLPEFERYVNSVTVTLRKDHVNGQQTLREVVLNRTNAAAAPGDRKLIYGWNGDDDRLAWLDYDYRARWSFKGGGAFETPWTRMNTPMIDLFAPYERRSVQMLGDAATLKARGVRAVVLQIEYPFFGELRRPQIVARPEESLEDKRVEITLPLGHPDYAYTLTWQLAGNQRLTAHRRDGSGLVFVDELP